MMSKEYIILEVSPGWYVKTEPVWEYVDSDGSNRICFDSVELTNTLSEAMDFQIIEKRTFSDAVSTVLSPHIYKVGIHVEMEEIK